MYVVFDKTLLTSKRKALVRHYQPSFDAQAIYRELSAHTKFSTKVSMNASALLSYNTTTLEDGKGKALSMLLSYTGRIRSAITMTCTHKIGYQKYCIVPCS